MKPVEFDGCNVVFGKDQPEYQPLPAKQEETNGNVVTCWELSDEEIKKLQTTKRIYLGQFTFGNSLQPILPTTDVSDVIQDK